MPNAHQINAANRKAIAEKTAKLKAERQAANRQSTKAEKTSAQIKQAEREAAQAEREAAKAAPPECGSAKAEREAVADQAAVLSAFESNPSGISAATEPATPVTPEPKRNEFQKTRDSVRETGALPHYAGLSQSVRRSGFKARNFSDYATSARSGNGHSPNSITERDLSAISAAIAYLADRAERESREIDLSEPFNPGAFGGDLSAFGIRGCGHGHFEILSDGSAMRITERGLQAAPRKPKAE